jgi:hypothetical protein
VIARRHAVVAAALVGAAAACAAAYAAYGAVASNAGNSFTAGTVTLSDNDSGSAMFTSLTAARANDSETSCIQVRSDGTLPSTVKLYGSVSGALAPYLTLTVTRGTDVAPAFDNCATFVPDVTNYIGLGAGILLNGALSSFPTTFAAGITDPAVGGGIETWTQNETHVYRFVVSVGSNAAAQGLSASVGFTWEARSQ